jgi:hypothetical protein
MKNLNCFLLAVTTFSVLSCQKSKTNPNAMLQRIINLETTKTPQKLALNTEMITLDTNGIKGGRKLNDVKASKPKQLYTNIGSMSGLSTDCMFPA